MNVDSKGINLTHNDKQALIALFVSMMVVSFGASVILGILNKSISTITLGTVMLVCGITVFYVWVKYFNKVKIKLKEDK